MILVVRRPTSHRGKPGGEIFNGQLIPASRHRRRVAQRMHDRDLLHLLARRVLESHRDPDGSQWPRVVDHEPIWLAIDGSIVVNILACIEHVVSIRIFRPTVDDELWSSGP